MEIDPATLRESPVLLGSAVAAYTVGLQGMGAW